MTKKLGNKTKVNRAIANETHLDIGRQLLNKFTFNCKGRKEINCFMTFHNAGNWDLKR